MYRAVLAVLYCSGVAGAAIWTHSPVTGHWYTVVDASGLIWEEAQDAAETQYGGYLATITSQAEQEWINTYLLADQTPPEVFDWGLYIGMRQDPWDPIDKGLPYQGPQAALNWTWVTGEPWSFTNWSTPVEPNDAGGAEDVGMLWVTDRRTVPGRPLESRVLGTWNDFYRFNGIWAMGMVVERQSAPVPEPASALLLACSAVAVLGPGGRRRRREKAPG